MTGRRFRALEQSYQGMPNARPLGINPMEYDGKSYRTVLGSDVVHDGMYMELYDAGELIAFVFRSDIDGHVEVDRYVADRSDLLDNFVEYAKSQLEQRNA